MNARGMNNRHPENRIFCTFLFGGMQFYHFASPLADTPSFYLMLTVTMLLIALSLLAVITMRNVLLFFVLETDAGERYSKAGAFLVDRDGYLVDGEGHYLQGENADVATAGLPWRYVKGPGAGAAQGQYAYDGLGATVYRFNEYRSVYPGAVPPVRGQANLAPGTGVYNPYSNTNAVDYCVRKNRDSDGNGVIEGDEIKWYMPTPAQAMQIYAWREAFRGGSWSLNRGYAPFSASSRYYWTTTEEAVGTTQPNAYTMDFAQATAMVTARDKNSSYPVRCVRDIAGGLDQSLFYPDGGGHVVINMTDNFPEEMIDDRKYGASPSSQLNTNAYNTLGRAFAVSRWYGPGASAMPSAASGNDDRCDSYSEPGFTSGWVLPSQEELSLIYAYAGMIENILAQQWPAGPGASTYHEFTTGVHWAISDNGTGSNYWTVDFTTGAAASVRKNQNQGYFRCIRYYDTRTGGADSPNIPSRP